MEATGRMCPKLVPFHCRVNRTNVLPRKIVQTSWKSTMDYENTHIRIMPVARSRTPLRLVGQDSNSTFHKCAASSAYPELSNIFIVRL
ncbi:uncharacterized protein Dana_GF21428 [Drosophila ananassae]|uniref:Uncharacterized protein n=1 Tax=Drosophila ananassae TaxID=7217 RepID=B3MS94_DROAN|nr:uncharacterized protein Dana_GF21428 [Drosophila ananassae]